MSFELIASATERTTSGTDLVLALASAVAIGALAQATGDPFRKRIWIANFACLGVASLLGAVAHGLELGASTRTWLWRPLYLALGALVAYFAVAAIHDLDRARSAAQTGPRGAVDDGSGSARARRLVPLAASVAIGFFALTQTIAGGFLVFVLYEAVALLFAFAVYSALAARGRLPGAAAIAVGIAGCLAAAAVQAAGTARLTLLHWQLDHNGVFHLIQLAALVPLLAGVLRGFAPRAGLAATNASRR